MRNSNQHRRGEHSSYDRSQGDQTRRSTEKKDFWDKVADDVAEGYGARGAAKTIRNRDQEPNDNRRCDEVE